MSDTARLRRVHDLLDEVFRDRERLTGQEFRQRAAGLDLSPVLRRLVDTVPDGEYDRDRAGEYLRRVQDEEGIWRDESRVSAADLDRAMATSGTEGQFDDYTGHESGPAEKYGEQPWPGSAAPEDGAEGGRPRPSPEGPSGPH